MSFNFNLNNTFRLSKSKYDRPQITYTDTLQTNANMNEKLQNYERVEDIDDIPINSHVRYVTFKNGKQRFCLGGFLTKIHQKYVILSNGRHTWSVQKYHWQENNSQKTGSDSNDENSQKGGFESSDDEPIFETTFFSKLSNQDINNKIIKEKNAEILKLTEFIRNNWNSKN